MMKWHNVIDNPEEGGDYLVWDGFCNKPFIATYHKAFDKWMSHRTRDGKYSQYKMPSGCEFKPTHWMPLPLTPNQPLETDGQKNGHREKILMRVDIVRQAAMIRRK